MSDEGKIIRAPVVTASASVSVPAAPIASGTPRYIDLRPKLVDFLRIHPIGQTRSDGAVTVTLLALEAYADGCAVTYRMQRRIDERRPYLSPEIKIRARDDRGERYKGWSMGCGGGGDGELFIWRGAHSLIPALDPSVRLLTLELIIGWRDHHASSDDPPPPPPSDPWFFSVPVRE